MSVKINSLQIENVKRVKAIKLEPTENGLTILGGKNAQGKSSVLDSIAWTLGGNKKKPSQAAREDSVNQPYLKVELNNGLIVERKGKNSDLQVTDPKGEKHGQRLLDTFVEELAIDLPKFIESDNKEKANTMLRIIGVEDQLHALEKEEQDLYNNRRATYQIMTQKEKYANELPHYDGVPPEFLKAKDLIDQQQEILAKNGRNQELRNQAKQLADRVENQKYLMEQKQNEIEKLQQELADMKEVHESTLVDLETAQKTASQLKDESTEELEHSIAEIEETNDKVRTNQQKEQAEDEARQYRKEYESMTEKIEETREKKQKLLEGANLPLPELSVLDGELTYKGQKWDNMSGAEQLRVSTAIVRKLKPDCGFVLIDKLEQMDLDTLQEFGQWLEQEQLQAIAARVTTGDEATIIIEDGEAVDEFIPLKEKEPEIDSGWKGGF